MNDEKLQQAPILLICWLVEEVEEIDDALRYFAQEDELGISFREFLERSSRGL